MSSFKECNIILIINTMDLPICLMYHALLIKLMIEFYNNKQGLSICNQDIGYLERWFLKKSSTSIFWDCEWGHISRLCSDTFLDWNLKFLRFL